MRAARRSWFSFTARVICANAVARSPISSPVSLHDLVIEIAARDRERAGVQLAERRVSRRDKNAASASANSDRRRAAERERAPRRQLGRDERVLVGGDGEHAEPMPFVVLQRRVADGEDAAVGVGLDDARRAAEHRGGHVGRRGEADLAPPVDGDERRRRRRVRLVDDDVGGELRLQAIGELGVERHRHHDGAAQLIARRRPPAPTRGS